MQKAPKFLLAMTCAAALLLSACGKNASTSNASVRFINVVPDSGSLNVSLDASASNTFTGAAFESVTAYQTVSSGNHEFRVSTAAGALQVDNTYSLTSTGQYTFITAGRLGASAGTFLLENTASTTSGTFKIRVSNLAYQVGGVDLYVLSGANTPATTSPNLAATAAGGTSGFIEVTKGDYRLVLTQTGLKQVIYDSGVKTFADQANITFLAYSAGSSQLANAAIIYPADGSSTFPGNPYARIKTIQAIPDLALMDLLVDGTIQFSNVPYQGASSYLSVGSGAHALKTQATNVPGSFLSSTTATFLGGRDYSVLNVGSNGVVQTIPLLDSNYLPATNKARVRFVNANLAARPVDVLVNFVSQTTNIAVNAASAYSELDANTYSFTFTNTGSATAVLSLPPQALTAGLRYTIYFVGTAASPTYVITQDI